MIVEEVQIVNRLGLHARAAARFVHLANRFSSTIRISLDGGSKIDGKSILGMLTLAAAEGRRLQLSAEGADEQQAIEELGALIRDRFGEDE